MQSLRLSWLAGVLVLASSFSAGAASLAGLPDFTPLVEENAPAVVNISASTKAKVAAQAQQQQVPEVFRRFFGDDFRFTPPPQQDRQSFGSGFIISADGYVLTNNHVVQGADKVTVRLNDRRELDAEVVGTDPVVDVALLKVSAKDLPFVKIGNPDKLKVGAWVLAIGSPFGFDYSVTAGIVSAKLRALPNGAYVPFIQTDVAINPGNSGGPLINTDGEVVGVNSQIVSGSGGYMGLSFSIPIDLAMEVVEQLKANGKVTRGYLGVQIQEVNKDLADAYGLPKPAGALVAKVLPDSPAAKAGVQEGDVITGFDGHEILRSSDLPQLVGRAKVGKKYPLALYRDHKKVELAFEVASKPDGDGDEADNDGKPGQDGSKPDVNSLNILIRDLSDAEKAATKLPGGVVVQQVSPGAAADAGIAPGDVIVKLNGKAVTGTQQFIALAKTLPAGQAVPVLLNRQGGALIVALRLEPVDSKAKDKAGKGKDSKGKAQ
jgi:serine protease Do